MVCHRVQKLLRVPDVADQLNIGRTTAYLWIRQGKIRSIRLGRLVRVTRAEIDRLIYEKGSGGGGEHTIINDEGGQR